MKLSGSAFSIYETHVWPLLDYGTLMSSNMPKLNGISTENVQRRFTKQVMGWSTSLNYKKRCSALKIKVLYLRRLKINLAFLHNLVNRLSFSTDLPVFFSASRYPFCHRSLANRREIAIPHLRLHLFLVVYARLCNKLPLRIRCIQS